MKISTRSALILFALFILALLPRLYSAHTVGWGWDYPGSFTLVNFDEAGSCRAALEGFEYSTFIGLQTVAISELLGNGVEAGVVGNAKAVKAYCHSAGHIRVARSYSAVSGALTVVLIGLITLMLIPTRPEVALTASALLALSGFHMSESQTGTVDAPSVFFIYLFLALMIFAVKRRSVGAMVLSPVFMLAAIWTKYWVFAAFVYLALIPPRVWAYFTQGLSRATLTLLVFSTVIVFALVTNAAFPVARWYPVLGLYYLVVPWRRIRRPLIPVYLLMPLIAYLLSRVGIIASFTTSDLHSHLGTGYAAIGWNKWLRNLVNVPAVLVVGLGLPACLFIPAGIRAIVRQPNNGLAWLCLAPVAIFALFMLFISPVTYYRHYLALIPAAALLSAYGLWTTPLPGKKWFRPVVLPLFFIWPALLALDIMGDHLGDPRMQLRAWYDKHPDDRVFFSYFITLSENDRMHSKLFSPEYAFGQAQKLKYGNYLILSENWYDTAFANELNGPVMSYPERLIKTKPEYAAFYREALAGTHPNLKLEKAIDVQNFMPELLIHKWLYGTFQMFVGDIKIYKVVN